MALIYAGIDEAGYGPLLGPLCVGLAAVRVEGWAEAEGAPNLWQVLSSAVCRAGRKSRRHIAIDDSKKLKLANSCTTRHPVYFLERGVGAFVACRDRARAATAVAEENRSAAHVVPTHDAAYFAAVGAQVPGEAWYAGEAGDGGDGSFPVGSTREEIMIFANTLELAAGRSGVCVLEVACEAMGEGVFNQIVETAGTKAAATETALVKHLRTIWDGYGAEGAREGSAVRVVCDRQGGRTNYTELLRRAFPECEVRETHANQTQSRYEIVGLDRATGCPALRTAGVERPCISAPAVAQSSDIRWHAQSREPVARKMSVLFMTESESAHLPVALASMTAKLTRELFMARFNRHWCGRMPELKPTAGYRSDAWRWLEEAKAVIRDGERAEMIRRA